MQARARGCYEQVARERQKLDNSSKVNLPYSGKGQARDKAGKAFSVSGSTVDHASKVIEIGVGRRVFNLFSFIN